MIAKSMLDYSWIEDVKNYKFFNSKSNILFIFEGVLMYFDESVMTKLLHTIIKKFGDHNLAFAIEFCSKTIANNTKDINLYQNYPHNLFLNMDTMI